MFVSPLSFFSNTDLSDWRGCFALGGTVFQTAVTISHGNPETSSRVTLASLGIGFQPNPPSMPLNNQKPTPIFLYFYLLIFFHPFNPYNPCSFHHWVFFSNTDLSDSTDTYWGQDTVNRYFTLPHGSGDWGTIPGFAEKHLGIWSGFWEKTYKSRTNLTYLWEPTPIHFN